jgi:hypothetical protein
MRTSFLVEWICVAEPNLLPQALTWLTCCTWFTHVNKQDKGFYPKKWVRMLANDLELELATEETEALTPQSFYLTSPSSPGCRVSNRNGFLFFLLWLFHSLRSILIWIESSASISFEWFFQRKVSLYNNNELTYDQIGWIGNLSLSWERESLVRAE